MATENKKYKIKVTGDFYIGDLCHCLSSEVFYGIFVKNEFRDGVYTDSRNGHQFASIDIGRKYNYYYGDNGWEYDILYGYFGIADLGQAELHKNPNYNGKFRAGSIYKHKGECEVSIEYKDGKIIVEWPGNRIIIISEDDWEGTLCGDDFDHSGVTTDKPIEIEYSNPFEDDKKAAEEAYLQYHAERQARLQSGGDRALFEDELEGLIEEDALVRELSKKEKEEIFERYRVISKHIIDGEISWDSNLIAILDDMQLLDDDYDDDYMGYI